MKSVTRTLAAALAIFLFINNCVFAHAIESNFWKDRQQSFEESNHNRNPMQVASLPVPFQTSPAQILNQIPSPIPHALSSSVSRQIPKNFSAPLIPLLQSMPTELGSIRKISVPEKSHNGKILIHIQDVHRNAEAQSNIGRTLENLFHGQKIELVALEGAFSPVDLSRYRAYEDKEAVRMTGDYLLRENRISGAVHAAFVSPEQIPPLLGVDDRLHYNANVEAYLNSTAESKSIKQTLASLEENLSRIESAVFNTRLAAFHSEVKAYRNGRETLGGYASVLSKDSNTTSPELEIFLEAARLETSLNFKQVELERTALLNQLLKSLNKSQTTELLNTSIAYRMGNLGHADFYQYLNKLCAVNHIALQTYPEMNSYIQYVLLSEAIQPEKLLKTLSGMEKEIYGSLAQKDKERELIQKSNWLHLVGKLTDFSLSPEEWEEYKSSSFPRKPASPAGGRESRISTRISGSPIETFGDDGASINLSSFERFYFEAEARNKLITQNLLCAMDERHINVAVLVTGGFHSPGIDGLLNQAGVTTVSFVPKISKVDGESGSAYLSVFAQEKTPLDKLFAGEKLFVCPPPSGIEGEKPVFGEEAASSLDRGFPPETVVRMVEHAAGHEMSTLKPLRLIKTGLVQAGDMFIRITQDHKIFSITVVSGFVFAAALKKSELAAVALLLSNPIFWVAVLLAASFFLIAKYSRIRLVLPSLFLSVATLIGASQWTAHAAAVRTNTVGRPAAVQTNAPAKIAVVKTNPAPVPAKKHNAVSSAQESISYRTRAILLTLGVLGLLFGLGALCMWGYEKFLKLFPDSRLATEELSKRENLKQLSELVLFLNSLTINRLDFQSGKITELKIVSALSEATSQHLGLPFPQVSFNEKSAPGEVHIFIPTNETPIHALSYLLSYIYRPNGFSSITFSDDSKTQIRRKMRTQHNWAFPIRRFGDFTPALIGPIIMALLGGLSFSSLTSHAQNVSPVRESAKEEVVSKHNVPVPATGRKVSIVKIGGRHFFKIEQRGKTTKYLTGIPAMAYEAPEGDRSASSYENAGEMIEMYAPLLPRGGVGVDSQKYPKLYQYGVRTGWRRAMDDATRLKSIGVRMIRTYNLCVNQDPALWELFEWLNEFTDDGKGGIEYIAGMYNPTEAQARHLARQLKSSQAVIAVDAFNEIDLRQGFSADYPRMDNLMGDFSQENPYLPVGIVLTRNFMGDALPKVQNLEHADFVALTIYDANGEQAQSIFDKYQLLLSPKAVAVGETGGKSNMSGRNALLGDLARTFVMTNTLQWVAPLYDAIFEGRFEDWKQHENLPQGDNWWGVLDTSATNALRSVFTNWVGPLTLNQIPIVSSPLVGKTPPVVQNSETTTAQSITFSLNEEYSGSTWLGNYRLISPSESARALANKTMVVKVSANDNFATYTGFSVALKDGSKAQFYSLFVRKVDAGGELSQNGNWMVSPNPNSSRATVETIPEDHTVQVYISVPDEILPAMKTHMSSRVGELHVQSGIQDGASLNESNMRLSESVSFSSTVKVPKSAPPTVKPSTGKTSQGGSVTPSADKQYETLTRNVHQWPDVGQPAGPYFSAYSDGPFDLSDVVGVRYIFPEKDIDTVGTPRVLPPQSNYDSSDGITPTPLPIKREGDHGVVEVPIGQFQRYGTPLSQADLKSAKQITFASGTEAFNSPLKDTKGNPQKAEKRAKFIRIEVVRKPGSGKPRSSLETNPQALHEQAPAQTQTVFSGGIFSRVIQNLMLVGGVIIALFAARLPAHAQFNPTAPMTNITDAVKFVEFDKTNNIPANAPLTVKTNPLPPTFYAPPGVTVSDPLINEGIGTYDSSLSIMALLKTKNPNDLVSAENMLKHYASGYYGNMQLKAFPASNNTFAYAPFTFTVNYLFNNTRKSGVWDSSWVYWDVYTGPNAWMLMAISKYVQVKRDLNQTPDPAILALGNSIAQAMLLLQTPEGGIRYGPKIGANSADLSRWNLVVSENDASAEGGLGAWYAVTLDPQIYSATTNIWNWFTNAPIYIPSTGQSQRGLLHTNSTDETDWYFYKAASYNSASGQWEIVDTGKATDAIGTWMIDSFGPERLDAAPFGPRTTFKLVKSIRFNSGRTESNTLSRLNLPLGGLDFTDKVNGVPITAATSMTSPEWSSWDYLGLTHDFYLRRYVMGHPDLALDELASLPRDAKTIEKNISGTNGNSYAFGPGLVARFGNTGVGWNVPPDARVRALAAFWKFLGNPLFQARDIAYTNSFTEMSRLLQVGSSALSGMGYLVQYSQATHNGSFGQTIVDPQGNTVYSSAVNSGATTAFVSLSKTPAGQINTYSITFSPDSTIVNTTNNGSGSTWSYPADLLQMMWVIPGTNGNANTLRLFLRETKPTPAPAPTNGPIQIQFLPQASVNDSNTSTGNSILNGGNSIIRLGMIALVLGGINVLATLASQAAQSTSDVLPLVGTATVPTMNILDFVFGHWKSVAAVLVIAVIVIADTIFPKMDRSRQKRFKLNSDVGRSKRRTRSFLLLTGTLLGMLGSQIQTAHAQAPSTPNPMATEHFKKEAFGAKNIWFLGGLTAIVGALMGMSQPRPGGYGRKRRSHEKPSGMRYGASQLSKDIIEDAVKARDAKIIPALLEILKVSGYSTLWTPAQKALADFGGVSAEPIINALKSGERYAARDFLIFALGKVGRNQAAITALKRELKGADDRIAQEAIQSIKARMERLGSGGSVAQTFRFPDYIWKNFKTILQGMTPSIYTRVIEHGLARMPGNAIHYVDQILSPTSAETVWRAAMTAINISHPNWSKSKRLKTIDQVKDLVAYHENLHLSFHGYNADVLKEFRTVLEEQVFGLGDLKISHPFIQAMRVVYGESNLPEEDAADLIGWYVEEFLVLSLQEMKLGNKPMEVVNRLLSVRTSDGRPLWGADLRQKYLIVKTLISIQKQLAGTPAILEKSTSQIKKDLVTKYEGLVKSPRATEGWMKSYKVFVEIYALLGRDTDMLEFFVDLVWSIPAGSLNESRGRSAERTRIFDERFLLLKTVAQMWKDTSDLHRIEQFLEDHVERRNQKPEGRGQGGIIDSSHRQGITGPLLVMCSLLVSAALAHGEGAAQKIIPVTTHAAATHSGVTGFLWISIFVAALALLATLYSLNPFNWFGKSKPTSSSPKNRQAEQALESQTTPTVDPIEEWRNYVIEIMSQPAMLDHAKKLFSPSSVPLTFKRHQKTDDPAFDRNETVYRFLKFRLEFKKPGENEFATSEAMDISKSDAIAIRINLNAGPGMNTPVYPNLREAQLTPEHIWGEVNDASKAHIAGLLLGREISDVQRQVAKVAGQLEALKDQTQIPLFGVLTQKKTDIDSKLKYLQTIRGAISEGAFQMGTAPEDGSVMFVFNLAANEPLTSPTVEGQAMTDVADTRLPSYWVLDKNGRAEIDGHTVPDLEIGVSQLETYLRLIETPHLFLTHDLQKLNQELQREGIVLHGYYGEEVLTSLSCMWLAANSNEVAKKILVSNIKYLIENNGLRIMTVKEAFLRGAQTAVYPPRDKKSPVVFAVSEMFFEGLENSQALLLQKLARAPDMVKTVEGGFTSPIDLSMGLVGFILGERLWIHEGSHRNLVSTSHSVWKWFDLFVLKIQRDGEFSVLMNEYSFNRALDSLFSKTNDRLLKILKRDSRNSGHTYDLIAAGERYGLIRAFLEFPATFEHAARLWIVGIYTKIQKHAAAMRDEPRPASPVGKSQPISNWADQVLSSNPSLRPYLSLGLVGLISLMATNLQAATEGSSSINFMHNFSLIPGLVLALTVALVYLLIAFTPSPAFQKIVEFISGGKSGRTEELNERGLSHRPIVSNIFNLRSISNNFKTPLVLLVLLALGGSVQAKYRFNSFMVPDSDFMSRNHIIQIFWGFVILVGFWLLFWAKRQLSINPINRLESHGLLSNSHRAIKQFTELSKDDLNIAFAVLPQNIESPIAVLVRLREEAIELHPYLMEKINSAKLSALIGHLNLILEGFPFAGGPRSSGLTQDQIEQLYEAGQDFIQLRQEIWARHQLFPILASVLDRLPTKNQTMIDHIFSAPITELGVAPMESAHQTEKLLISDLLFQPEAVAKAYPQQIEELNSLLARYLIGIFRVAAAAHDDFASGVMSRSLDSLYGPSATRDQFKRNGIKTLMELAALSEEAMQQMAGLKDNKSHDVSRYFGDYLIQVLRDRVKLHRAYELPRLVPKLTRMATLLFFMMGLTTALAVENSPVGNVAAGAAGSHWLLTGLITLALFILAAAAEMSGVGEFKMIRKFQTSTFIPLWIAALLGCTFGMTYFIWPVVIYSGMMALVHTVEFFTNFMDEGYVARGFRSSALSFVPVVFLIAVMVIMMGFKHRIEKINGLWNKHSITQNISPSPESAKKSGGFQVHKNDGLRLKSNLLRKWGGLLTATFIGMAGITAHAENYFGSWAYGSSGVALYSSPQFLFGVAFLLPVIAYMRGPSLRRQLQFLFRSDRFAFFPEPREPRHPKTDRSTRRFDLNPLADAVVEALVQNQNGTLSGWDFQLIIESGSLGVGGRPVDGLRGMSESDQADLLLLVDQKLSAQEAAGQPKLSLTEMQKYFLAFQISQAVTVGVGSQVRRKEYYMMIPDKTLDEEGFQKAVDDARAFLKRSELQNVPIRLELNGDDQVLIQKLFDDEGGRVRFEIREAHLTMENIKDASQHLFQLAIDKKGSLLLKNSVVILPDGCHGMDSIPSVFREDIRVIALSELLRGRIVSVDLNFMMAVYAVISKHA